MLSADTIANKVKERMNKGLEERIGPPTKTQLEKINRLAKRTLSADEVFVFSGKSAGDLVIPDRYMQLSPEILKVMVDDAKKGVSFMFNHSWAAFGVQAIPFGKVFDGRLKKSITEGETVEMFLDKYILRDDEIIDGISANALIKRIETGVLSDTSIGWGTDVMVCSICGMNYWGGDCSHLRGRKYKLADGTEKICAVTAMPPSIIIPYNNNALYEESIVWDGAYPGATVAQAKHGDIIEIPTGNFAIIQDKEELPEGTLFRGYYHNGNIVTMIKKSDRKKIFSGGAVSGGDIKTTLNTLKGGDTNMGINEELFQKMLDAFGVKLKDGKNEASDILAQLAEKWDETVKTIQASADPITVPDPFMTQEQVAEKLGKEYTAEEVLKLAKDGIDFANQKAEYDIYRQETVNNALEAGVRAMGNDFPKDTWEATFATMGKKQIEDIAKTWQKQAEDTIPAGRHTDPKAGQAQKVVQSIPNKAYKTK